MRRFLLALTLASACGSPPIPPGPDEQETQEEKHEVAPPETEELKASLPAAETPTNTGTFSLCTTDGEVGCITSERFKATDADAFSEADFRTGKTIAGKAGELSFFKDMANTALFDRTTGDGAAAGIDFYDSIDDYNNGGAQPTQNAVGWDQATGENWKMDPKADDGSGGGVAKDGLCNGTEACVFRDSLTGLMWSKEQGTGAQLYTWEEAITLCENLNYGTRTDWRLPTHKELLQGYINGVWGLNGTDKLSLTHNYYWAATTLSFATTNAFRVYLTSGYTSDSTKTLTNVVLCVR